MVRPFLRHIWAALSSKADSTSQAPLNCIWRKQIMSSLVWVRAFLDGTVGSLHREFYLSSYLRSVPCISITLDASPWGIGGILAQNNIDQEYFYERIEPKVADFLKVPIGDASAQQAFEALAILVALRLWKDYWIDRRAKLTRNIRRNSKQG